MVGPNTHREALIAELLGDVGDLLDRTEALKTSLPAAADAAMQKIKGAGDTMAANASMTGERFLTAFDERAAPLLRGIQQAAKEAGTAARVVDRASRRFLLLATLLGFLGGLFGAAVTYFALIR
jgi:hypothetical protein